MPQSDGVNTLKRMEFSFKGKSYKFNLNPEEYTQDEPSKSQVTQTKSGAWVDDFGAGLKSIYMKGTTGLNKGNGFKKFKELRKLIRDYYTDTKPGKTIKDELIFHNFTDEESWVVHPEPSGFRLLRSKSNPLLYMYEIRLVCLRETKYPGTTSKTGVGKTLGTPTKLSTKSTTSYEIGNSYIAGSLMVADKIPKTLASFVSQLKALAGGQLAMTGKKISTASVKTLDLQFFASGNDLLDMLEVEFDPVISKLATGILQQIKDGVLLTRMKDNDLSLLVDKIRTLEQDTLDPEVMVGLQSVLLELLSVSRQIIEDPEKLRVDFSIDDLKRLRRNLRWVTNKMAERKTVDYSFVEELRWLERAVMYLMDSNLFEDNIESEIIRVNVSMGRVTDG
ncbi:hypothetical protein Goe26_01140 [Bacillus phage vB_BsuM-Goe26]|nr:hypothetical protein Goe26_01140 [Bacillus phage vB_BsuM-Goe26]